MGIRVLKRQFARWLIAAAIGGGLVSASQAQFRQQGGKLVGTGAVGSSSQGRPVAISVDGGTAIVGGNGDDGNTGAAWVYTRAHGAWVQQGDKLAGTGPVGAAQQGVSVALSADGNTAIVGGNFDNNGIGAAWVFTRAGGVWSQQGGKLVGTGAVGPSGQGVSVSLSWDGNTALVGGRGDNGNIGAVWVFSRVDGLWGQQGNKLVSVGGGTVFGPLEQGAPPLRFPGTEIRPL